MTYICTQHEQGAGAAADAYSRITQNLGAAMVTSGPGGTNLLTSVCNAYFDSIPVVFICGQVATFRIRPNSHLRQKGFQETDIVGIFTPVTKYAKQLKNSRDIKYELQKAVHMAKEGRPGPVLLDIPDDLQREQVNPEQMRGFVPPVAASRKPIPSQILMELAGLIGESQRPVLILGAGVRVSNTVTQAVRFAEHFQIPVLLTWGAADCLPHDHPLNMGTVGVCGPRAGNFAVQNSDLVIALGTRLSQMVTGGKQNLFAVGARKVMVDVDAQELNKFTPNDVVIDLPIEANLTDFFKSCEALYKACGPSESWAEWGWQIKEWAHKYPVCPPQNYQRKTKVDAHVMIKRLSAAAKPGDIIITDAGGNLSWTMQAWEAKAGQRVFSAWNHSPMGYSVPAAIGAALAGNKPVICITGDGGLMMCVEELGTIRRHDLPVKVLVFNNQGHGIQKQTMDTWMNSRYVGVDHETGLYFPDFIEVGKAFGFSTFSIENHSQIDAVLKQVMETPGPVLCDVAIVPDQKITPMLKFGAGLEDLEPKLAAEEIERIMSISRPLVR